MSVKRKQICFVCLRKVDSSKVCSSRVWEQGENETGSEFDLYINFIQFATNYLKIQSTTFKQFLSITNTNNGVQIFCEKCRKTVQHICNSYLELIQLQLRLSWKLGELEKLMESAQCLDSESELVQELAHNLGIDDAASLEKIRELLSVRCEQMSQKFQPQLVLKRNEAFPVEFKNSLETRGPEASSSQSDHNIKKEVEEEDQEDDWCPSREDEIVSNSSPDSESTGSPLERDTVFLLNSQIKEEDNSDHFDSDAEDGVNANTLLEAATDSKSSKDFQCCFCWMSFNEPTSLNLHINALHSRAIRARKGFPCEVEGCQKQFATHLLLNIHLEIHSKDITFCKICGWGFIDRNLLELHKLVHIKSVQIGNLKGRRVSCPVANCTAAPFKTISKLQSHYNIHHGVSLKFSKCLDCEQAFESTLALSKHQRTAHPKSKPNATRERNEIISCEVDECQEQFTTHSERNAHLATHSEVVKACKSCGFGFIDENLLKLHSLVHIKSVKIEGMKKVQFCCPESGCEFKVGSTGALQSHFNKWHGIFHKTHKCLNCDYVGPSSRALRAHLESKHNTGKTVEKRERCKEKQSKAKKEPKEGKEKPRGCAPCKLEFSSRRAFNLHRLRLHIRRTCKICNEAFIGRLALQEHTNHAHPSAGGKFVCATCSRGFPTIDKLALHKKQSHGEKLQKCEVCHKVFKNLSLLRKHHLSSHELNPRICSHCGNRFSSLTNLNSHVLRCHTDGSPKADGRHQCPHCPLRFGLRLFIHRHIFKCHPDAPENLTCSTCGLKMDGGWIKNMERHQLTHLSKEEKGLQG